MKIGFTDENTRGYTAEEIDTMNEELKFRIAQRGYDLFNLTDNESDEIKQLQAEILEQTA